MPGTITFLLFCNDLRLHLTYLSCIQFADDTTLYTGGKSIRLIECEIDYDLEIISDWFRANKLTLNLEKTVCMIFPPQKNKKININIKLLEETIPVRPNTKFLGLWLDSNLDWDKHFSVICSKLKQNTGLLRRCKNFLDNSTLRAVYFAHVHSYLSYSLLVWGSTSKASLLKKLQKMQNSCIKIMEPNSKLREGFTSLKILPVDKLIELELCKFFYKLIHDLLPSKLMGSVLSDSKGQNLGKTHSYPTRQKHLPNLPRVNAPQYKNSFLACSNKLYSSLPDDVKKAPTLTSFVKKLKE